MTSTKSVTMNRNAMSKQADRSCHSFVAREHYRPALWISRKYLDERPQISSYRTWAIISPSLSRHSGRREELALTKTTERYTVRQTS